MHHTIRVIAIDGPAASGKSTLAADLARRLGFLYVDTGVMYRAVTLAALQRGLSLRDEPAVSELAERIRIDIAPPGAAGDGRACTVLLDGDDVTWAIRAPEVDAGVSIPSAYARVRTAMVEQQRALAGRASVVMVGRDIGTVVLPGADLKIYLDATVEERARRRYNEMATRGEQTSYEDVLAGLRRRDQLDAARAQSPMRPAGDAVIVDSTRASPGELVDAVLNLVNKATEREL